MARTLLSTISSGRSDTSCQISIGWIDAYRFSGCASPFVDDSGIRVSSDLRFVLPAAARHRLSWHGVFSWKIARTLQLVLLPFLLNYLGGWGESSHKNCFPFHIQLRAVRHCVYYQEISIASSLICFDFLKKKIVDNNNRTCFGPVPPPYFPNGLETRDHCPQVPRVVSILPLSGPDA